MTYSTFDLTEHTQFSIRGTTGTHPDSEYVFGVFIGTQKHDIYETGKHVMPDIDVYDDVDWDRAVQMAKWILEWDERFKEGEE